MLLRSKGEDTMKPEKMSRGMFLRIAYLMQIAAVTDGAASATINPDDLDATAGEIGLDGLDQYQLSNAYTGEALGSPTVNSITASSPINFVSGHLIMGRF